MIAQVAEKLGGLHQSVNLLESWLAQAVTSLKREGVDVDYSFMQQVRRITGEDNPGGREGMESHLASATTVFDGIGRATAYALFLDFDDSTSISSRTFGARLQGSQSVNDDLDILWVL